MAMPEAIPAASAAMPSGSLFSGLKHELMGLPSKSNAITLAIGGALALAAHPADRTLTHRAAGSVPLDEVFDPGDTAGSGWVQGGAALATWLIGRESGNARVQAVGADLVQAQLVAGVMTQGLKLTVGRSRPNNGRFSFPSGHASATFANAAVLQRHFGWKAGLPAYGVATYVAASRLQDNRHYASDVIFGAALGIVAGRTMTVGHGHGAFALAPVAVPGGAGVTFTRLQ
jgi:membrane-associated phospholipid phosphatase